MRPLDLSWPQWPMNVYFLAPKIHLPFSRGWRQLPKSSKVEGSTSTRAFLVDILKTESNLTCLKDPLIFLKRRFRFAPCTEHSGVSLIDKWTATSKMRGQTFHFQSSPPVPARLHPACCEHQTPPNLQERSEITVGTSITNWPACYALHSLCQRICSHEKAKDLVNNVTHQSFQS